jgi:hypothetical protein
MTYNHHGMIVQLISLYKFHGIIPDHIDLILFYCEIVQTHVHEGTNHKHIFRCQINMYT